MGLLQPLKEFPIPKTLPYQIAAKVDLKDLDRIRLTDLRGRRASPTSKEACKGSPYAGDGDAIRRPHCSPRSRASRQLSRRRMAARRFRVPTPARRPELHGCSVCFRCRRLAKVSSTGPPPLPAAPWV